MMRRLGRAAGGVGPAKAVAIPSVDYLTLDLYGSAVLLAVEAAREGGHRKQETLLCAHISIMPSMAEHVKRKRGSVANYLTEGYAKPLMGKKVRFTIDVTEAGRAGGRATAANRTPKERTMVAREAARARWDAYYKAHPEKKKTARTAASRKKGN